MKVTLISPYQDIKAYGLRIISSVLKKSSCKVDLIFLPKSFKDAYSKITLSQLVELSRHSDLIGISLMTNFFDSACHLTDVLKKNTSIPVIWGGVHPTVRPEECLNHADMVCVGEGEEALEELLFKKMSGSSYLDTASIWFRENNRIIKNPIRPLIRNLDNVPFQDYSLDTHYILKDKEIVKVDSAILDSYLKSSYVTMPTRGCPLGCTYCCNNAFNKIHPGENPVRKRSVQNIIDECSAAKSDLPFIRNLVFDDDAFFVYSEEEIANFSEIYARDIGLPLKITGAAPSTITEKKLSLLIKAGLKEVKMGIQTGSEQIKRMYNRRYTNDQVEKAAKALNKFKDDLNIPAYDIILDNPWETERDLIETLIFLSGLPIPYQLTCFSLTFYPGTELYEKAKRDLKLTDDLQEIYHKDYNFYTSRKNYLNRLFFLLSDYAFYGVGISKRVMLFLTNKHIRAYNVHWPVYLSMKILLAFIKLKRIKFIMLGLAEDVRKRRWTVIRGKLYRWL